MADDGGFIEAVDGLAGSDYGSFRSFGDQLVGGFGSYVVTDSTDGPTTAVDLRPVVTDESMVHPFVQTNGAATVDGATVALVYAEYAAVDTSMCPPHSPAPGTTS